MSSPENPRSKRAIILGAGSAGGLVAREIGLSPHLGVRAVAFIDDDPLKRGAVVEGIPVRGGVADLAAVSREVDAELAILAMPSAPGPVVRSIATLCQTLHIPLRTVPSLSEILSGFVKVSALREVDVADLLRRAPTAFDPGSGRYLEGARVLVTGAGGSIGSELCRQVIRCGPAQLVLFDVSENALYEVDRQLRKLGSKVEIIPVIGNIRERAKVERVLNRFRPGVVFHAAAYKHVPLTEINEDEAVLNILFGTRNVVEACEQEGVERFVLVSTDKAVDARAIMGASKRSAELLVQAAAQKCGRRFVAVRFGNVLASSGSVVPLFREQIAAGGPVTVGHQDLERYFMTVQEASSLVVSAGDLGAGGEIFVLDMGEPVSILTLAEDLIRLSGFEPGRDMQIVFTGLRPGEKMKESLFHPGETPQKTAHPRIFHAHTPGAGTARVDLALEGLEEAALSGDTATLRERLAKLVPSLPV